MGTCVGVFGARQVTPAAPDLAHLVVTVRHHEHVDAGHVPARDQGLSLRLVPGPSHLEDLRPVHAADARVQRRHGQWLAPSAGGLCPLSGPPEIDQLVARIEQAAVDRACPRRLEVVGEGGQHRLVKQGQPLPHPGLFDQRPPFEEDPQGHQGVVAEPAAEVLHPPGQLRSRCQVATHEARNLEVEEVAVLRPLRCGCQQPLGSGQPSVGLGAVSPQAQVEGAHEGGEGRSPGRARLQVEPVGLAVALDRLVGQAQPICGLGQGVVVGGVEFGGGDRPEPAVRSPPLAAVERLVRLVTRHGRHCAVPGRS